MFSHRGLMLREEGVMVRISTSKEIQGKIYIYFFFWGGINYYQNFTVMSEMFRRLIICSSFVSLQTGCKSWCTQMPHLSHSNPLNHLYYKVIQSKQCKIMTKTDYNNNKTTKRFSFPDSIHRFQNFTSKNKALCINIIFNVYDNLWYLGSLLSKCNIQ